MSGLGHQGAPGLKGVMNHGFVPHPGVIAINIVIFILSNLILVPIELYYAKKIYDNADSLVMYVHFILSILIYIKFI